MDSTHLCIRRVDELVAALAIFDSRLVDATPAYLQAAAAVVAGDGEASDAAAITLVDSSCSGSVVCTNGSVEAALVFNMPSSYPETALQCHVTSPHLPRHITDALTTQLQQRAAEAAGSECLHEMAEVVEQQLESLAQQQLEQLHCTNAVLGPCDATCEAQSTEPAAPAAGNSNHSYRCVLLRLDHMRSKASYSKTIKQWAKELTLTGFLLFWQNLILILLEGSPKDIDHYLYLARTVCVDVDSSGRKCRERMMDILDDSSSNGSNTKAGPNTTSLPSTGKGSKGSSSVSTGGGSDEATICQTYGPTLGQHKAPHRLQGSPHSDCSRQSVHQTSGKDTAVTRVHTDFRVYEVVSIDDVVQLLEPTHPQYTRAVLIGLLGCSSRAAGQ